MGNLVCIVNSFVMRLKIGLCQFCFQFVLWAPNFGVYKCLTVVRELYYILIDTFKVPFRNANFNASFGFPRTWKRRISLNLPYAILTTAVAREKKEGYACVCGKHTLCMYESIVPGLGTGIYETISFGQNCLPKQSKNLWIFIHFFPAAMQHRTIQCTVFFFSASYGGVGIQKRPAFARGWRSHLFVQLDRSLAKIEILLVHRGFWNLEKKWSADTSGNGKKNSGNNPTSIVTTKPMRYDRIMDWKVYVLCIQYIYKCTSNWGWEQVVS